MNSYSRFDWSENGIQVYLKRKHLIFYVALTTFGYFMFILFAVLYANASHLKSGASVETASASASSMLPSWVNVTSSTAAQTAINPDQIITSNDESSKQTFTTTIPDLTFGSETTSDYDWLQETTTTTKPLPNRLPLPSETLPDNLLNYPDAYVKLAEQYKSNMDPNVDPCDNFFQYACGNYKGDDDDVLDKLNAENRQLIIDAYNDMDLNDTNLPEAVRMSKIYFDICAKSANSSKNDFIDKYLLSWIHRYAGDWPLTKKHGKAKQRSIWKIIGLAKRHFSHHSILPLIIMLDIKNTSQYILTLQRPLFYLKKHQIYSDVFGSNLDAENNIRNTANSYINQTDSKKTDDLDDLIDSMLRFQTSLADGAKSILKFRDAFAQSYKYSLQELKSHFPNIGWDAYFSAAIPSDVEWPDHVVILDLHYVIKLNSLVKTTSISTLYNYVIWQIIEEKKFSFETSLLRKQQENQRIATDTPLKLDETPETCLKKMEIDFTAAVNYVFLQQFQHNFTVIRTLLETLRDSFENNLLSLTWIDKTTLESAMRKIKAIITTIGYPEWQTDPDAVNEHYKNLKITSTMTEFEAEIVISEWDWKRKLRLLRLPANRSISLHPDSLIQANAEYLRFHNRISVFAGILRPPIYLPGMPEYSLYGTVGSIVAHEITHGFDDDGVEYGYNGTLHHWITNASQQAYSDTKQCMIDHYSKFCVVPTWIADSDDCVNGTLVLDETMADSGGLNVAIEAFKAASLSLKSRNVSVKLLPGFDAFNEIQLFFLAFANNWCNSFDLETIRTYLSDPHPPNRFRVNGAVENMPEFAEAFECPIGAEMNPMNRCVVW